MRLSADKKYAETLAAKALKQLVAICGHLMVRCLKMALENVLTRLLTATDYLLICYMLHQSIHLRRMLIEKALLCIVLLILGYLQAVTTVALLHEQPQLQLHKPGKPSLKLLSTEAHPAANRYCQKVAVSTMLSDHQYDK